MARENSFAQDGARTMTAMSGNAPFFAGYMRVNVMSIQGSHVEPSAVRSHFAMRPGGDAAGAPSKDGPQCVSASPFSP